MVALARQSHPIYELVPHTDRTYGVVFATGGVFEVDIKKLPPRTLAIAIIHVLQYEENFSRFNATGHVIDLVTGREVRFDRHALVNDKKLIIF